MAKLPRAFYTRPDVVALARELLGMALCTRIGGQYTVGRIVETEAYAGPDDRASHAHGNRRTRRTEPMFAEGGTAYVYLCYGLHTLFNVVTHGPGVPHAILVRAIEPLEGIPAMLRRRGLATVSPRVGAGPALVSQALGIAPRHSGIDLTGERIWIEDRGDAITPDRIVAGPRVGVGYAGEDALLPWRFRIAGSPWVSRARGGAA